MKLIDIFSGCGGFSLGARQAGFNVVAAFDNDPILASSYPHNFPDTRMILKDVKNLSGEAIQLIAGGQIGGIFGGPPCQAFSTIGKRDPKDPRRQLLIHFFRIIKEIRPFFFVMENVTGLALSNSRDVLGEALRQIDEYAILGPQIWNAAQFGASTNRSRLFVIGIHKDYGEPLKLEDVDSLKCTPATVRAAIGDLEFSIPIGEKNGFDVWRTMDCRRLSSYARFLHSPDRCFTGHQTTVHSKRVRNRFKKIPEGSLDPIGRHPRLAWSSQSPALRAGTGADRGSYQAVRPIHPRYSRVITVREAARLQGFPDNHLFHPTKWHSFRMIGNSVSPFMARAIFTAIREKYGMKLASKAK